MNFISIVLFKTELQELYKTKVNEEVKSEDYIKYMLHEQATGSLHILTHVTEDTPLWNKLIII